MTKLISVLSAIVRAGCGIFGVRMAEEPNYQVLSIYDDIQIRRYPALVVAQTEVNADYQNSSRLAFQRLAAYIFGNNKKQQTLAMTAPVIQQQVAENLAMTAPVIQEKLGRVWLMAFVLPQGYSVSAAPIPLDSMVSIKEVPAKTVAVIRYTGSLSEQGIEAKSAALISWLNAHAYKMISTPRSAAYDPPWTLPFLRRNEVHVDIEA